MKYITEIIVLDVQITQNAKLHFLTHFNMKIAPFERIQSNSLFLTANLLITCIPHQEKCVHTYFCQGEAEGGGNRAQFCKPMLRTVLRSSLGPVFIVIRVFA
jgi:hypothetical protein